MSRSLYLIAALLGIFSLIAGVLSFLPSGHQPGLPASASPWRTNAMFLALGALALALMGVLTNLFEQVDRRGEQRRQAARAKRQLKP